MWHIPIEEAQALGWEWGGGEVRDTAPPAGSLCAGWGGALAPVGVGSQRDGTHSPHTKFWLTYGTELVCAPSCPAESVSMALVPAGGAW